MKNGISRARLSVLCVAVSAAFPLLAQTQAPLQKQTQTSSTLKSVVVSSSRFEEAADTLPYGVGVITAQDIHTSGVASVSEAIMKLLGVAGRLDLSGGNNYALDLRGFGTTSDSNQVVIVDGRRINEGDSSSANLSAIQIESVERIEVIHGAAGAVQYGEGATGGVIVVTTKAGKGVDRKNAATLGASVGSFATRGAYLSAALVSGGFSVDVNAKDARSNGHRDNFASTSNNLASTVQWSNDWLRLGVQSGRYMLQSGLPGSLSAAQYQADPAQAASLVDKMAVKNENAGVFLEAEVGDWQLGLDAGQRSKKLDSLSLGSAYAYNVNSSSANLRARHSQRGATLANALVVGLDSNRWDRTIVQSAFTPTGTVAKADAHAWYLTDDLTYLPSGTGVSVGVRTEALDKSEASSASSLKDRQNAWHLGVNQAVGSNAALYARVGQSFRMGNADEFSFTNPGVAMKAQTSRDLELGARWGHAEGRVELRWYRSDLSNEIGYDPAGVGPFGPFGANINLDPTRRQGVELDVRHALGSTVEVRANAAVRQARFSEGVYAGKDIALVPAQTASFGVDWQPLGGHVLGAGVRWVSTQYVDFDNRCSIPAYSTVDVRYAYTTGKVEFALGVKNLADTKYYTQAFTCTAGVTNGVYPEPGRAVTASVQFKF